MHAHINPGCVLRHINRHAAQPPRPPPGPPRIFQNVEGKTVEEGAYSSSFFNAAIAWLDGSLADSIVLSLVPRALVRFIEGRMS